MSYLQNTVNVHVTGRRVVATIIDGLVLSAVYAAVRQLFGVPYTTRSGFDFTRLSAGGSIVWLVVVTLYYVILEGYAGATLGKLATGIRVISESTGRPPGFGGALLRTVLRLIDGLFSYLVGFIIVLASPRRRRLGDMVARTLVVRA